MQHIDNYILTLENQYDNITAIQSDCTNIVYLVDGTEQVVVVCRDKYSKSFQKILLNKNEAETLCAELSEIITDGAFSKKRLKKIRRENK